MACALIICFLVFLVCVTPRSASNNALQTLSGFGGAISLSSSLAVNSNPVLEVISGFQSLVSALSVRCNLTPTPSLHLPSLVLGPNRSLFIGSNSSKCTATLFCEICLGLCL